MITNLFTGLNNANDIELLKLNCYVEAFEG